MFASCDSKLTDSISNKAEVKKLSDRLSIIIPHDSGSIEDFAADVKTGLTSLPKYLLPKYFYDNKGSALFEKITELEEYYPTDVEKSIIKNISKILPQVDKNISMIVEIGSGSSNKTKHIIKTYSESREEVHYVPIDISEIVIESSENLIENYFNIKIDGIIADYKHGLEIVPDLSKEPKLYLFLGSSIGNFTFNDSINFLKNVKSIITPKDKLLIGFDRDKDRQVLHQAYDDNSGVTAEFNLNILNRINKELNANFNLNDFEHQAKFNEKESRIEMHLVSKKVQKVNIADLDLTIHFDKGESIHTENSYKYTIALIEKLAEESGFEIEENFMDNREYFSLCLFKTA